MFITQVFKYIEYHKDNKYITNYNILAEWDICEDNITNWKYNRRDDTLG